MERSGYILALDQGTTGTTAILLDPFGSIICQAHREITQHYPNPGWVEHSPEEIFGSCMAVIEEVLEEAEASPRQVRAMGIANQRETTIIWDRDTGRPVTNAIVWQCRRTVPLSEALKAQGWEADVRARTGLPIDPYFSATKIRWILDHIPEGQRRAERGELAFGTVDSWLIWNLTNGGLHVTDVTNASRTMLFNINTLRWDPDLLAELDIPRAILPDVRSSSEVYGEASGHLFRGESIPIAGIAGDQHAALFGQACFEQGATKNTYGTGCFVLMNTGAHRIESGHGLVTTIAWQIGNSVVYALEGSIFSTGATVQWLRDGLNIIDRSSEIEDLANLAKDNGGVYLVPAFVGLAAPHWDPYARGTIVGLTRGVTRAHLARAALESTAYQTRDVIEAMQQDTGLKVQSLRVDGGGSANDLLMQFQADILDVAIERCAVKETTALGAGYLAGLGARYWGGIGEIESTWRSDRRYEPKMTEDTRKALYRRWLRAVSRSRHWALVDEPENRA
jgi:glycerol kinase